MREEEENPLDLNNLPEDFSICRDGKQMIDQDTFTSGCGSSNISGSSSSKKERGSNPLPRGDQGEGEDEGGDDENDNKVYECRFCSLKFCKSQALGGHMNRHRQERETETLNKARQLVYGNDNLAAFPQAPPHIGTHHMGGGLMNHHHHHHPGGFHGTSPPHIYPTTRMLPPLTPPAAAGAATSSAFLTPRTTVPPQHQPPYLYTTPTHPLASSYAAPHSHHQYPPPPPVPHHHQSHPSLFNSHHRQSHDYFVGHMTTNHIPSTTAHPEPTHNNHHHPSAAGSSYTCFGAPVGLGLPGSLLPNRGVLNSVGDGSLLGQDDGSSWSSQQLLQHLDSSSSINVKSRFPDGL